MLNYVFESKVPVPSLSEWRFPVSISQRDLNISLFRFSAEVGCRCLLCQGELSSVTCTSHCKNQGWLGTFLQDLCWQSINRIQETWIATFTLSKYNEKAEFFNWLRLMTNIDKVFMDLPKKIWEYQKRSYELLLKDQFKRIIYQRIHLFLMFIVSWKRKGHKTIGKTSI